MVRRMLLVVALTGAFLIALAATPQGRTAVKTALFVPQIVPALRVHPQEWFAPQPTAAEVRFPAPGGQGLADLYRPGKKGTYAGVVLFLGVNPAGRDDPRVVGLAQALARSGMVALFPWSQSMTENRIEVEEIGRLVAAFEYLKGLEGVDPRRVGMGGFCIGASFALVAAADPGIRDQVAFVNFFGGYYDASDLVKQIASRTRFYGDARQPWQPGEMTSRVFGAHLIAGLQDPGERSLLERLFIDGQGPTEEEGEKLSPEGRAVYQLLKGVPLEEAEGLVRQLPATTQEALRRVSPRSYVAQVRARVLVMADREDNLIPATESRRLAEALAPQGKVYYTEFSLFQHMDPTRPVGALTRVKELGKLFLHLYQVLKVAS